MALMHPIAPAAVPTHRPNRALTTEALLRSWPGVVQGVPLSGVG